MDYKKIEILLNKRGFFGFTCKRDKKHRRFTYKFINVSYHGVDIIADTIKVDPKQFKCSKLVADIYINGEKMKDFKEFILTLNDVYKIWKKIRYKDAKEVKHEHIE